MSLLLRNIQIPVEEGLEDLVLKKYVASTLEIKAEDIGDVAIRKKSLDARKKNHTRRSLTRSLANRIMHQK